METFVSLLTEKEVAAQTGLSVYTLWRMRRKGHGIPFLKISEGRLGRVRYRQEDVAAYIAMNPHSKRNKRPAKPVAPLSRGPQVIPLTLTCKEAAARHPGVEERHLARLCLRGKAMAKRYGGASKVPAKELDRLLFGRKVGRSWHIPIAELDRVFLGNSGSKASRTDCEGCSH